MTTEKYGRYSLTKSKNPFTCGLTGKTYTASEMKQRVELLSRALAKRLGFAPNEGTEWDKVVALYSLNTVSHQSSRSVAQALPNCYTETHSFNYYGRSTTSLSLTLSTAFPA